MGTGRHSANAAMGSSRPASGSALLAAAVAVLIAGCLQTTQLATEYAANEPWSFEFDGRNWKLGYSQAVGFQAIREYVLAGESVEGWTELVTSIFAEVNLAPRAQYAQLIDSLSRGCPSLVHSMIEESDDSVLWEWRHEGCQGYPPQHSLTRAARRPMTTASFTLTYVAKTGELTPATRERWLAILRSATIRPHN